MNFDRNYQSQTVQKKQKSSNLIGKIQKLPILPRIYLYVFLMAVIGGGMGEAKYRLEATDCMSNGDCWMVEPAQRRVRELGLGATAGIIAATLISIPALLEEN